LIDAAEELGTRQPCGVTGSAFLYSQHLVPEEILGDCELRDVIHSSLLQRGFLFYDYLNS